jgi:pSer/pThr/pTyr-binding forkhead associated (FHA) protein
MNKLRISLPDGSPLTFDLGEDRVAIGRLPDNDLHIEDDSISSHHAEITFDGTSHQLTDLGSTNGTFLNGEQTTEASLNPGDKVRFGQIDCVFEGEEPGTGSEPLPESGSAAVALGSGSARPPGFSSASPFPKPSGDTSPIGKIAVALGVLALLSFGAAVALTVQMSSPV